MRTFPVRNVSLSAGEVHIWHIPLAGQKHLLHALRNLLSANETQRADRFFFERDRESFIVAHAAMRQILGRYVPVPAEKLAFSYGEKGKPELAIGSAGPPIKFNLSHSGGFALLAVAERLCLGVDIEFVKADFAGEEIAQRFFSSNEVETLRAIAAGERVGAFFCCWTRKEAYIKALGGGLSIPLDSFDVAFGPGVPAALLGHRISSDEVKRWSIYDIAVPPGYKAALAAEGTEHRLQHWDWKGEFKISATL